MKASELIKFARTQLGYIGKRYITDDLDAYEAPNGNGEYTKYARDLWDAGFYNGNKQGYNGWCTLGVDWCFYMLAGSKEESIKVNPIGVLAAGADWAYKDYVNADRIVDTPKLGDRVFFMDSYGRCYHVGLVSKDPDDTGVITTLEFNGPGDVVYERERAYNDILMTFGRPYYEEEDMPDIKVGDRVKLKKGAKVYGEDYEFSPWVYDADLYVRDISGDRVVISTFLEGPITGSAYMKDIVPIEPEPTVVEVPIETLEDLISRVDAIKHDLEKLL